MKPVKLAFPAAGVRPDANALLFGHVRNRRTIVLAVMSLVLAGGLLALAALRGLQVGQDAQAARAAVRQMREHLTPVVPATLDQRSTGALTQQQRQEWNQVIHRLNTPWTTILDALESSMPDTVALVAIEPDSARSMLRLQVEAKTLDLLLAYVASLKSNEVFKEIGLLRHETNEQDPNHPVRLSIELRMRSGEATREATLQEAQR